MKQLIYGVWGESDRDTLIQEFLPFLRQKKVDNCYYVVPTAGLAADIRERLLAQVSGWVGKPILTFDDLIARIVRFSPIPVQRIDTVMQERAIHHIMEQSDRIWAGKPLKQWAKLPGVVRTMMQTIAELRRSGISVEHVREFADEDLQTVTVVWQQYETWLRQNADVRLIDIEESFRYAEELLQQYGIQRILPQLACILFDHFVDFTPLQKRILSHFRRVDTCIVYIPVSADTGQAHSEIKGSLSALERILTEDAGHPFDIVRGKDDSERWDQKDLCVEITPVQSMEKQWLWVAKEIKKRSHGGVPLERMAILVPNLKEHIRELDHVLQKEHIPHRAVVSQSLRSIPFVQEMITFMRIASEQWRREDVLAYAVQKQLLGERIPVHALKRLAVKLGIQRGYDIWQERLQTYLQSLNDTSESAGMEEREFRSVQLEKEIADVRSILQWLASVHERIEPFLQHAPLLNYIQQLFVSIPIVQLRKNLVQKAKTALHASREDIRINLRQPVHVSYIRRDMRAIDALYTWAEHVKRIERRLQREHENCSLQEFVEILETDWEEIEVDAQDAGENGVWILEPTAARGLVFDHVFFANLNEGTFPKPKPIHWLLREEQRRALIRQGLQLPQQQLQMDLQHVFFTMAFQLAKQRLDLLYVEEKGMLRSRFLETLMRDCPQQAEQWSRHIRECTDAFFQGSACVPAAWQDLSQTKERDMWLFAHVAVADLQHAMQVEYKDSCAFQEWQYRFQQIAVEDERMQDVSRYRGTLRDPEIRRELQERFHKDRVYSASFFNQYGSCPFQFFVNRVLAAELPDEEGDILAVADRGNLYHRVLFRLYEEWRENRNRKLTDADRDKWLSELRRIVAEELAALEQSTYIGERLTWQIEKERIQEKLEQWLEYEMRSFDQMDAKLQPHRLEWSFGMPLEDHQLKDPNSTAQPIEMAGLKFAGRIDRIDYAKEHDMYAIYDYKTTGNSLTGKKDLERGIDFQLAVYLQAVGENKELLGIGEGAAAAGALYYGIEKPNRGKGVYHELHKDKIGLKRNRTFIPALEWEETLEKSLETIQSYHQSMQEGEFAVQPRKCTTYCPYKRICRFDPIQSIAFEQQKQGMKEEEKEGKI
ncbi:PD-(D/E)XK nuclease family protein [Fodinisporobacter ferrooxydans]|uniref:PD-(D/E)XK nuclease family protein n=1 Tax=Fodinisporobacter ferrooxydans TaxID=2901836 RepID=A0ABY4CMD6_9BACL|nr:PD-(D/E)XK nuclease family protein [Alicyclobacillaceae bacterium MYW30-H2]